VIDASTDSFVFEITGASEKTRASSPADPAGLVESSAHRASSRSPRAGGDCDADRPRQACRADD